MYRAIDKLAKVVPSGQLNACLGPVVFLGSAADYITELTAEVSSLRTELARKAEALEQLRARCVRAAAEAATIGSEYDTDGMSGSASFQRGKKDAFEEVAMLAARALSSTREDRSLRK